jgi:F-type H+-transporting ATPase subunit epsilon
MADRKVAFELVSPERLLLSEPVDMVVVPGAEGDFGVLPGHTRFISTLRPGVIATYEGTQVKERIFVAGGFAEASETGCTVLADSAERVGDIDLKQVENAIKAASEDAQDAKTPAERAAAEQRGRIAEAKRAAAQQR